MNATKNMFPFLSLSGRRGFIKRPHQSGHDTHCVRGSVSLCFVCEQKDKTDRLFPTAQLPVITKTQALGKVFMWHGA